MTPKNLNTIVEFLEGLQEQMQDGESTCKVYVTYFYLCQALAATGKYDDCGYKYAEVTEDVTEDEQLFYCGNWYEVDYNCKEQCDLCKAIDKEILLLDKALLSPVTQQDRNEKYSLDQHNSKEEFLHEFKS